MGIATGTIYNFGYFLILILRGYRLLVFRLMTESLSLILADYFAEAVCIGLGKRLIYTRQSPLMPQYLTTEKSQVTGLTVSVSVSIVLSAQLCEAIAVRD